MTNILICSECKRKTNHTYKSDGIKGFLCEHCMNKKLKGMYND